MSDTIFFGYGSLANIDTFPEPWTLQPATLLGWRRAWRNFTQTPSGVVVSLSVFEDASAEIDGVLLRPGDAARQAWLDQREGGYEKVPLGAEAIRPGAGVDAASLSAAPARATYRSLSRPERPEGAVITLSYIDAVLQGFMRFFGEEGARRFIETTDGWDTPIENDRSAPRYPRSVRLSSAERAFIDHLVEEATGRAP